MSNMTTGQVMQALRERYCGKAWAFFPQVRSSAGFFAARTADAIVMSLWPSRGLELHGFEIKVTRSDWLRELKKPEKVEEGAYHFCDRWWIVVGDKAIVRDGELPPTWGLLVPRGNSVIVKVDAPKLEPKSFGRSFLSALLRQAAEYMPEAPPVERDGEAYKRGCEDGRRDLQHKIKAATRELDRIQRVIGEFEAASGIKLPAYSGSRIGRAVQVVMDKPQLDRVRRELVQASRTADRAAEALRDGVAQLTEHEETKP